MPGIEAVLRSRKPDLVAEEGDSVGAQLRRRRRELGHRRVDAAQLIGIDPKSLMWWERNVHEPREPSWPSIIAYLGREPWRAPETLAERLLAERRRRGLFISEAAAIAGVDESTFCLWEGGHHLPRYPRTKRLVAQFLGENLP